MPNQIICHSQITTLICSIPYVHYKSSHRQFKVASITFWLSNLVSTKLHNCPIYWIVRPLPRRTNLTNIHIIYRILRHFKSAICLDIFILCISGITHQKQLGRWLKLSILDIFSPLSSPTPSKKPKYPKSTQWFILSFTADEHKWFLTPSESHLHTKTERCKLWHIPSCIA